MRESAMTARFKRTLKTLPRRGRQAPRTMGPTTHFRRVPPGTQFGAPVYLASGRPWRKSLRGLEQKRVGQAHHVRKGAKAVAKAQAKRAGPSPLLLATYGGGGPAVRRLLRRRQLVDACHAGDIDAVRAGLAAGFSADTVDAKGRPLLFVAAWKNRHEAVAALLYAQADCEKATVASTLAPDATPGRTALLVASKFGHTAVVERLLAGGAKPSFVHYTLPSGCTPLYAAAVGGHRTVVARLLAAGADPRPLVHGLSALDAVHDIMRRTVANETLADGAETQLAMERDTVICRALEKALVDAPRFSLARSLALQQKWQLKTGPVERLDAAPVAYADAPLLKAKNFDLDASLARAEVPFAGNAPDRSAYAFNTPYRAHQWQLKTGPVTRLDKAPVAFNDAPLVKAKNWDLAKSLRSGAGAFASRPPPRAEHAFSTPFRKRHWQLKTGPMERPASAGGSKLAFDNAPLIRAKNWDIGKSLAGRKGPFEGQPPERAEYPFNTPFHKRHWQLKTGPLQRPASAPQQRRGSSRLVPLAAARAFDLAASLASQAAAPFVRPPPERDEFSFNTPWTAQQWKLKTGPLPDLTKGDCLATQARGVAAASAAAASAAAAAAAAEAAANAVKVEATVERAETAVAVAEAGALVEDAREAEISEEKDTETETDGLVAEAAAEEEVAVGGAAGEEAAEGEAEVEAGEDTESDPDALVEEAAAEEEGAEGEAENAQYSSSSR